MLPAGLGFLSVSKKALVASRTATHRRCFFSFEDMIRANDAGYFPYTPATQLLRTIQEPGAQMVRLLESLRKTKGE